LKFNVRGESFAASDVGWPQGSADYLGNRGEGKLHIA
jgi:hypothetical protein